MMRVWVQVGLCVLLVCGALAVGPVAAQGDGDSDAPYIYYYSYAHNAFVIERADGTDTRLLGEGLPGGIMDGPGWSPSGNWFAWTATTWYGTLQTWTRQRAYIMSADGTQRLKLLDGLNGVQMVWAGDDILFVAGTVAEQPRGIRHLSPKVLHRYVAVIDVPSGTVLNSMIDTRASSENVFLADLQATVVAVSDGEHMIAAFENYPVGSYSSGVAERGTADVYIANLSGDIEKRGIADVSLYWSSLSLSPDGILTYQRFDEQQFVVENLLIGDRTLPEHCGGEVVWSPEGSRAFTMVGAPCVIDAATLKVEHTSSLDGASDNALMHYVYESPIWSPDGTHALISDGISVQHLDARAATTEIIVSQRQVWGWVWIDGARALVSTHWSLLLFDFETGEVQEWFGLPTDFGVTYFVSPDERYFISIIDSVVVYDRLTGEFSYLRPPYLGYWSDTGGMVYWDDTQQWLLILDRASGTGGNYWYLSISQLDGSQRRDLTALRLGSMETMYTWLPPQVDLEDLPPVLERPLDPQPKQTFTASGDTSQLAWSPDGTRIAAEITQDSRHSRVSSWAIWDIETGEAMPYSAEDTRSLWAEWGGERTTGNQSSAPIATSPDGQQEIVIDREKWATQVRDASTGELLATLRLGASGWYSAAVFIADGQWCVTGNGGYYPIVVWNTSTWTPAVILPNPGDIAFSPDGTQLAVAISWDVQIWNVADLLAWGAQEQAE
jgi:WD40 repeat protein